MPALAGGPMIIGGPHFGIEGQAFTWDAAAMPINYRVDSGPLSATSLGTVVIDNATGTQRLQAVLANWQNVPTAAISFNNAGLLEGVREQAQQRGMNLSVHSSKVLSGARGGPLGLDDFKQLTRELGRNR